MAPRETRADERTTLWRLVFISMTRVFNHVEGDVKHAVDLTLLDLGILFALAGDGAESMSRLARLYGVDPSVITYRVGRLERMGLAQRAPGENDRRVIWVTISTDGRAILRDGRSAMLTSAEEHFFAHLDPGDLPVLTRLFGSMTEAGRPEPERPPTEGASTDRPR